MLLAYFLTYLETDQVVDRHVYQTSQIMALNQPNNLFLRHLLRFFKSTLEDENISFFDEPTNDWVSLSQHDRLDQLICLVPLHETGRAVFVSQSPCAEYIVAGNDTL